MGIVVVLVLLAAPAAALLRAVHTDGRGHTPPVRSHLGWGDAALPSGAYSRPTSEGA